MSCLALGSRTFDKYGGISSILSIVCLVSLIGSMVVLAQAPKSSDNSSVSDCPWVLNDGIGSSMLTPKADSFAFNSLTSAESGGA